MEGLDNSEKYIWIMMRRLVTLDILKKISDTLDELN